MTEETFLKGLNTLYIEDPETGCWNWKKGIHHTGYGVVDINSKQYRVHKLMYILINNYNPTKEELVCHSCDNPPCVNPKHLLLGTSQSNMTDMVIKGRWKGGWKSTLNGGSFKGSTNNKAKLSEEQIPLISQYKQKIKTDILIANEFKESA